jgi:hypothetical protein
MNKKPVERREHEGGERHTERKWRVEGKTANGTGPGEEEGGKRTANDTLFFS